MEEYIFTQTLIVEDREAVETRIAELAGARSISLDAVKEFIEAEPTALFFVDNRMSATAEGNRDARYAFIDTGYVDEKGRAIFISLYSTMGYFTGSYVGHIGTLGKSLITHNPKLTRQILDNLHLFQTKYEKKIAKRKTAHLELPVWEEEWTSEELFAEPEQEPKEESEPELSAMAVAMKEAGIDEMMLEEGDIVEENAAFSEQADSQTQQADPVIPKDLTPVTEEIFEQLLFPSWNSIEGLDRYIKIIGTRIVQLMEQGRTEYYVTNSLKSVIVNTGLMNRFGADFMVMYRINLKYKIYEVYKIMDGKADWIRNGFTKEQTAKSLKPISFFNPGERIFEPTADDFDINYKSLLHIIEERRSRFPEGAEDMSNNQIATLLQNALQRGIKMQQRDQSYAKAIYSTKTGSVSWVLPFHVFRKLVEEPELVLVIRKNGEFYEIKTVLPYDADMKDKITALSLYSKVF